MKKTLLFVAAVATLAGVACKKDSNSTPSRSQLIQGTWKPSFTANDKNGNKVLDADERVPTTDTGSIVFKGDGTGSATAQGISLPFSWKFFNNEQALITTSSFGSDTSYIHTLTSNEFIIENRDGVTYTWNGFKK